MGLLSRNVSTLLNGVSQQPPMVRLPSQLEEQQDCMSNPAVGLSRRPPLRHLAKLAGTNAGNVASYTSAYVHDVVRDATERYTIVVTNGKLEVFDPRTGVSRTVNAPNGFSYLNVADPRNDLRLLTIEDYTFVVNRTVTVAMGATTAYPSFAIGSTVNRLTDLPATPAANTAYRVMPSPETGAGSYWVAGLVGNAYSEIPKPGTKTTFDAATMPHAVISEPDGTFTFRRVDWDPRVCGDIETVPEPGFVGKRINDIFYARGRLGFVAGNVIATSRSGQDYFNFWRQRAYQVLSDDPIDVTENSPGSAAGLHAALPFNQDVVIFSPTRQYRLSADSSVLTVNTITAPLISAYKNSPKCRPLVVGDLMWFVSETEQFSDVYDYTLTADLKIATATPVTSHCPEYVPADIVRLVGASDANMLFALSSRDLTKLYVFNWLIRDNQRQQAAWHVWNMPPGCSLLDVNVSESMLLVTYRDADGVYFGAFSLSAEGTDDGSHYMVCLDRRVLGTSCGRVFSGGSTTITLPWTGGYTAETIRVVPRSNNPASGISEGVAPVTINAAAGALVVPGDWSAGNFFVGIDYTSWGELTEIYPPVEGDGQQGGGGARVVTNATLNLNSMTWALEETAAMCFGVYRKAEELETAGGFISIEGVAAAPAFSLSDPGVPSTPAFVRSGVLSAGKKGRGRYRLPIHQMAHQTVLRFGSYRHYPFIIANTRWHGEVWADERNI